MACRDPIGFRAAWAHCPVDTLPSGCPELVEAVADHGAGCVDLPLFPNLVNSPPIAAYACSAGSVHGWCTGAGAAPSDGSTRATAEAVPWNKRVVPVAATAALALYGNQVRRTKNKRVRRDAGPPTAFELYIFHSANGDVDPGSDGEVYNLAKQRAEERTRYKPRDLLLGL